MGGAPSTAAAATLADLVARYDGRAPRYTSYPPATQFTPQVDAGRYREWLAQTPLETPLSVYVHIPFCARLCWYCGCNTRAIRRREPIGEYVRLLLGEMTLLAEALPGAPQAGAVHFGGGTPNMLSLDELHAIFDGLAGLFRLDPELDVAIEMDPAVLTADWVRAAGAMGMSRASLGVQTLDPRVQAAVNRCDRFDQIARCVGWLRTAEVGSINLDLMYGLPHQTTTNMLSTLEELLTLRPERFALFGYAHVPWMKRHQELIDSAALPDARARLEQSARAAERLVDEGYVRIGIDHFALPDDPLAIAGRQGGLHRNFQGYVDDPAATLLGLGASAIGSLPQGFVQNAAHELTWREAVSAGRLPIARGVELTAEDRFRAEIIERLMCDFAVDLDEICARHGRKTASLAGEVASLAPFVEDGLVEIEGPKVAVLEPGRPLARSVAAAFDAYFSPEGQRHAKAI